MVNLLYHIWWVVLILYMKITIYFGGIQKGRVDYVNGYVGGVA